MNIGLFISEWWTERIQLFDMHFMFLNCYKYPSILFLNCSNFPEVSEYENNPLSLGPSEKKICDSFWAFPAFQYHFSQWDFMNLIVMYPCAVLCSMVCTQSLCIRDKQSACEVLLLKKKLQILLILWSILIYMCLLCWQLRVYLLKNKTLLIHSSFPDPFQVQNFQSNV